MDAPPTKRAEREREAREAAERRRRVSVRLGSLGVLLLFLGAIGTLLQPDAVAGLLVLIALGFVLVLAAFLAIRGAGGRALRIRDLTKGL